MALNTIAKKHWTEIELNKETYSGDIAVAYPTFKEVEEQSKMYKTSKNKKEHIHRSWLNGK